MSDGVRWAWRPQKALVECPLKEIFSAARAAAARRMACWASGRSKRSARALIICDFKEMDRLPMASGFSAIQNNSGVSQGLSPRLAAQSTTRAVGILMPLSGVTSAYSAEEPLRRCARSARCRRLKRTYRGQRATDANDRITM
jgi:hypothetical protein